MQQYICVITCEAASVSDSFVKEARFFPTLEEAVSYGSRICQELKPSAADFWIYSYCGLDSHSISS